MINIGKYLKIYMENILQELGLSHLCASNAGLLLIRGIVDPSIWVYPFLTIYILLMLT